MRGRVYGPDLGAGLFVLLLGALALWQAAAIQSSPLYAQVGPRAVPYGVAACLALIGAGLVVVALRGGWSSEMEEVVQAPPTAWRSLAYLAAGLIANVALIEWLGFVLAATVQFVLVCAAFGSRALLRDLGIGLAVTVSAYLFFARVLGVSIGAGILEGIL
ncbi:MAG: tripartite tricarboxylate transporter TctB family protein [Rhodospirillales bacterium]|jgi:putative tricarboxylic transport membrane protein|nr:tripartite tricarboxylate transporter TctB family protein [Rhodospirillales bacterium]MDB5384053.1 tripartite tricarboxylate transporter TctB family protein [Rhodospirillales bacterium]